MFWRFDLEGLAYGTTVTSQSLKNLNCLVKQVYCTMTAEETQPLHIPFQSPLRLLMPFVVGITLGLCCAITFAACQKQTKIIEDHSPIALPAMAPPIEMAPAVIDEAVPGLGTEPQLPSDSIEKQMEKTIQVPATPETAKMKAVLEGHIPAIPATGKEQSAPKAKKPMPDEATLRVPKQ